MTQVMTSPPGDSEHKTAPVWQLEWYEVQLAGSDYLLNLPTHLSQGLKNRDASLRPVFSLQVPIPAGLHPLRLAGHLRSVYVLLAMLTCVNAGH